MESRREWTLWSLSAALVALATYSAVQESFVLEGDDSAAQRAVQIVRSEWAEGDGVLVLPGWDDSLYSKLVQPNGEGPAIEGLIRGERLDPVRLFSHKRLWVLSRFGHGSTLPGLIPEDVVESVVREDSGSTTLSLVKLADAKPRGRLTDHVPALIVKRHLANGETRNCRWRQGKHRCDLQSWLDVRLESHNVYHRDVSWLYAHAGPDRATLSVTWPDVPRAQALVVRVGFTQSSTRHQSGSPTLIRIYVDDTLTDEVRLAPHHYHQATQVLLVPAGETTMGVRFEVSADESSWRQVMLQADLFDSLPATLRAQVGSHGDTP